MDYGQAPKKFVKNRALSADWVFPLSEQRPFSLPFPAVPCATCGTNGWQSDEGRVGWRASGSHARRVLVRWRTKGRVANDAKKERRTKKQR